MTSASNWSMNAKLQNKEGGRVEWPFPFTLCVGMSLLVGTALYAQTGQARFVNNTQFTVRIIAGSGRTEVCTVPPYGNGTGRGVFSAAEYFYPEFDVPLAARFRLQKLRPADPNFFYQIDDRRGSADVIIDTVPPLADAFAYIALANISRTGGVSVARAASSRLSRFDSGGDNVNAEESGMFRIDPRDTNEMRIASPVNIAFPSITYRPGYRYVFTFDGTEVALIDARPLHAIGLPVNAAVVFEGAVPADEQDALRKALNDGLAANTAPLRAPPDGEMGEGDADVRYVFSVAIMAEKRTATFPSSRTILSGEAALTLSRNGRVIMERKTPVTEFDEAGIYRVLRQFLSRDGQLHQAIAGAVRKNDP
jgi:hypothetical protein